MRLLNAQQQSILDSFDVRQINKSPHTRALYRLVVSQYLMIAGGQVWTPQSVLLYLNDEAKRNSQSTVSTKAIVLAQFLKYAAAQGQCEASLAGCCQVRKPSPHVPRTATGDEVSALLGVAKRPKDKLALLLASQLGLRESEVRGLQWMNVDLDQKIINVFGKGSKWRTLPLIDGPLLDELVRQKGDPMAYLVPGCMGKQLVRGAFGKTLKKLCNQAGITPALHCHTLRHGFASNAHRNGVSSYGVQRMLGHSSLATTEIYLQALGGQDSLRDELQKAQGAR